MLTKQIMLKNKQIATIREAAPADAAPLLKFINTTAGETDYLTFGAGEFELSLADEATYLEKFRNSPTAIYLIATLGDQVIGSLSFQAGRRARVRHTGEFGVSVLQAYWGEGIGSSLIESMITWAKATKIIRKINLRVRTDNQKAIRLYEKFGFVRQGLITREFIVAGEFFDVLSMGLEIN